MSVKVKDSSLLDSFTPPVNSDWTPRRPYACRPGIPSKFEPFYPTWKLSFQKLKHSTHTYNDNDLSQNQLEKICEESTPQKMLDKDSGEVEWMAWRLGWVDGRWVCRWTWAPVSRCLGVLASVPVSRWTPHQRCWWRQRRFLLQLLRHPSDPVDKLSHSSVLRWFSRPGWKIIISWIPGDRVRTINQACDPA